MSAHLCRLTHATSSVGSRPACLRWSKNKIPFGFISSVSVYPPTLLLLSSQGGLVLRSDIHLNFCYDCLRFVKARCCCSVSSSTGLIFEQSYSGSPNSFEQLIIEQFIARKRPLRSSVQLQTGCNRLIQSGSEERASRVTRNSRDLIKRQFQLYKMHVEKLHRKSYDRYHCVLSKCGTFRPNNKN